MNVPLKFINFDHKKEEFDEDFKDEKTLEIIDIN
jgi:hypothetical protein